MKTTKTKPIEKAFRALCEARHRWLIVTAVTSGIALATLLPLVDDYFAGRNERKEIADNLREARLDADDLQPLQEKVDALKQQTDGISDRTVSRASVGAYRSRIVDLARTSNCKLRRISIGDGESRPWRNGDHPLGSSGTGAKSKQETGLTLHRQTLALSVSGTMSSLKTLLDRIQDEQTILHVKSLDIRPTGQNRKSVILDMELWFFQFARSASAS